MCASQTICYMDLVIVWCELWYDMGYRYGPGYTCSSAWGMVWYGTVWYGYAQSYFREREGERKIYAAALLRKLYYNCHLVTAAHWVRSSFRISIVPAFKFKFFGIEKNE